MKNTKKALLTSALCLLLCMSMLIGTTFAWFTDSVATTNNVITAGNLDVNLYYKTTAMSDWAPVEADTDVFSGNLWEPGHTEVVYLKVVNEGTLALKYNLDVVVASEVPGTNVANDPFKLSDYILYNVYEEIKTYADSAAARGDESGKMLNVAYNKATTLKAGEETVLTLVAFMPTTVGNEANYLTGTTAPSINLGINLFATQETYENDSFGPTYDEDANLCNFIVTSEAELVAALAEAKTGDIIGVKGNVTWTTGAGHGSTPFVTNATYITLVGLGEDATFTAIGSGVGPVGIDNGTVAFKNLKIADESVSYAEGSWEFGYLEFRGNTVFENCDVVNAIMMEGESASFKNCTFNSNKDSEYAVWVSGGDATFENCYITGSRGVKIHEAYGSEVGTVVINDNEFINLSKKPGLAIGDLNADTTVVLTNNTFAGTQAGDQDLYSYETDTDVTTFNFTDENNEVIGRAATNTTELKAAIKQENTTVYLTEGTYSMGGNFSIAKGTTIVGGENVVIEGTLTSSLNNVKVENVTFKSGNAQRWAYASGDVVFENCTFEATSVYAIHYDGTTNANITYKDCTIVGWVAIAGGHNSLTFDGCTIYGNGYYGVIRTYSDATIKNCTFDVSAVNTGDVYQDGIHAVDCTITVENCTNVNGAIEDIFNVSGTGVINKQ